MRYRVLIAVALISVINACKKSRIDTSNDLVNDGKPITTSASFYPMQIGNYWKYSEHDYTQIVDTIRISGKLFYQFYSYVGGDAIVVQYLRIDENQNLVEGTPSDATYNFIHAEFNAKVNDTFHTLNSSAANNFLVTVLYKSSTKMTFQENYTLPAGNSTPIINSYYKGIGPDGQYTTIKIDGIVYNYH